MSKNPKDRDDRNKGRNDNYDRRIIVDPPSDEQKKQPEEAVSSRRKGFYIILLLGITAIGIYAVLNSLLPHTTAKKPNETKPAQPSALRRQTMTAFPQTLRQHHMTQASR